MAAKRSSTVGEKIIHSPFFKAYIKAGKASAAPPLGPQLGQKGIPVAPFIKEFNEKTKNIKKGVPLPTRVKVHPDKTFTTSIHTAPMTYFVLQAAGAQKGAATTGTEVAGKISLKHVYEIATIKSKDPPLQHMKLEAVCKHVIAACHSIGIQVVPRLDAEEYEKFLEERKVFVEERERALEEERQSKMMRL